MAIIRLHTRQPESENFDLEQINHKGSVISWVLNNIYAGENFKIYQGGISKSNEISRDPDKMMRAKEVDIFLLPAGTAAVVALVVSAIVVTALIPEIDVPTNVNRNQQSPNNSLTARNNIARPNQRIVDVCGQVKSIPDVIQAEWAQYNNNIEERIGYYCVARNMVKIDDVKDGDSLIENTNGASAGVYYPNKSPNNSAPDIQIGDPINELVKGVYQSSDAIGQVLNSPNSSSLTIDTGIVKIYNVRIFDRGYLEDLTGEFVFTDYYEVGDKVDLVNIWVSSDASGAPFDAQIGLLTHDVVDVSETRVTFDTSGDPSWDLIDSGNGLLERATPSLITRKESKIIGPFDITSQKAGELLVNVYAPNGMYKENSNGKSRALVQYDVIYQKLDDNLNPIGPETTVSGEISGIDANERGKTTRIDLLAPTYVRWSLRRNTDTDFNYDGAIVDEIKLKDVFGLFDVNKTDFGNVTTIQTKRNAVAQATAIRNPELNCIATEMIYKYQGGGVFDTELTPNTQAMQSLIRLALDPFIGRRRQGEIDLDQLLSVQDDIEGYFQSDNAGQFSYSFDSTKLTAEQVFFNTSRAAFTSLWREGRILKAWFEKPQSIPQMVFTHRSKQPNSEAWNRDLNGADKNDSIEFVYTDASTYKQETLYYPADRSGTNPKRVEMPGVKGVEQATWQMMRAYNKMIYQEISVDFGATAEGRFVRPKRMISVVKGTRADTYDGNVLAVNGLQLTLSQDVVFTAGDDHYIILKRRDGSTESLLCSDGGSNRVINLLQIPSEDIYVGNDELKTEFSFGNEARLSAQQMIAEEISPSDRDYVKIKAVNYSDLYYQNDPDQPIKGGFDSGFDGGFN